MTESSNATFASIFAAFDTSPQCQRIEGMRISAIADADFSVIADGVSR